MLNKLRLLFLFNMLFLSLATRSQRITGTINSDWKFNNGDVDRAYISNFDDSKWENVNIPHTWNISDIIDDKEGYNRGVSWYRKDLHIGTEYKNKRVLLFFEAVSIKASVYINGKFVGEHLGAYTAFSFDISDFINYNGTNVLAVKADNSKIPNSNPISGDFSMSGGIYRDVYLIATNDIHFSDHEFSSSGIHITTPNVSKQNAGIKVKVSVKNTNNKSNKIIIKNIVFDEQNKIVKEFSSKLKLKPNTSETIDLSSSIENPKLWSPEDPYLYSVKSQIIDVSNNSVLDEVVNPLGFRWFSVDAAKGFFLNGKPYKLKGASRHQDYEKIGVAASNLMQRKDMELLKNMGANFVRISHYPQDPEVYKACDELGLIVWSEIPIVNEIALDETFYKNCEYTLKEMIFQNYNHPSVIMWGYMNEVFGSVDWYWADKPKSEINEHLKHTELLAKRLEKVIEKVDPDRLSVIAFHTEPTPELYNKTNLTSITSINGWNVYQGWYHNNLDSVGTYIDKYYKMYPKKAIFLSEYGAGSDTRIHTNDPTIFDFSTEYQDKFHKKYLIEGNKRDFVAGFAIWNLIDYQRDGRGDAMPNINSKGVVRNNREPKDVYYLYQAYWLNKPMVHIAAKDWTKRVEIVDDVTKTLTQKITVYSNQNEIELFNNGISLGKKATIHHEASWNVPFINGKNQLEAKIIYSKKILKDFLQIDMNFIAENLRNGISSNQDICINVGQTRTVFIDDLTKEVWISDREYTINSFGYVNGKTYTRWQYMPAWEGIREGIDSNILGTDNDPVFQTFRIGIDEYRFDVPKGSCTISLFFAEPFKKEVRLKPEEITGADKQGEREFNVYINDVLVISNLNLAKTYGEQRAVIKDFKIINNSEKGVIIRFEAIKGKPILNGIRISRHN